MKSNLDLLNECDVLPYPEKDPRAHAQLFSNIYTLIWEDGSTPTPVGYILESVLKELVKVPTSIKGALEINRSHRTVSAFQLPTEQERSKAVAATCDYWRAKKTFKILEGWRNELYPVYGLNNELLYSVERSASTLLGIVTYGVHMTAYTRSPEVSHGIKIWVPRRAAGKQTYAGMLDNTVAGGTATGEDVFECLVRECDEEASLPEEYVRKCATAHGTTTYIYIRDSRAGGESGMIQPECEYIYDLELPPDLIPKPNDSEVQEFFLCTVDEVQEFMAKGEFKPNCALVILDFFIRHGIITSENERNYEEIKSRLHRDLDFPGPHRS